MDEPVLCAPLVIIVCLQTVIHEFTVLPDCLSSESGILLKVSIGR
jgi:hypothetical protein